MPVFLVMVSPEGAQRYIDSLWALQDHAKKREEQLVRVMEVGKFVNPRVWVVELVIEDAKLVPDE